MEFGLGKCAVLVLKQGLRAGYLGKGREGYVLLLRNRH